MKYVIDHGDGETSSYEFEITDMGFYEYKVKMTYDKDDAYWTNQVRGKACAKLKNHGNGVNIKFYSYPNGGIKKIKLDYDEVVELYALLEFYLKDSKIQNFVPAIEKYEKV